MATVLPFDPNARRRTPAAPSRQPVGDAGVERVVPLPVQREPRSGPRTAIHAPTAPLPRTAVPTERAPAALTEREVAARFFPLMLLVALLDLASKAAAVATLAGTPRTEGLVGLHLVYNRASAGSAWLGAHAPALNVAVTGAVIGVLIMLVPVLARVDRRFPTALALMAGGGLGNLASLVTSPHGVPDFLAVRLPEGAWVVNGADLFMLAGVAGVLTLGVRAAAAHRAPAAVLPTLSITTVGTTVGAPRTARRVRSRLARAAVVSARCLAMVAVGAAGTLYVQRNRMVGLTACVPGTPLIASGVNPFSALGPADRAATLAHEARHAAQIRQGGCLSAYRVHLFGTAVERTRLEVDAGCAELALQAPLPQTVRARAESTLARTFVHEYASSRRLGFERTLALTREHCDA